MLRQMKVRLESHRDVEAAVDEEGDVTDEIFEALALFVEDGVGRSRVAVLNCDAGTCAAC